MSDETTTTVPPAPAMVASAPAMVASDMATNTDFNNNQKKTMLVHYIDLGDYYSIYYISTTIVVLLLLWYLVRSVITNGIDNKLYPTCSKRDGMFPFETHEVRQHFPELLQPDPEPIQMTPDDQPKPYDLSYGTYGDVPIGFYDTKDIFYGPEWYNFNTMFVHNSKSLFQQTNTPVESLYW